MELQIALSAFMTKTWICSIFAALTGTAIFINTKVIHKFTSEQNATTPNFLFSPAFISAEDTLIYQEDFGIRKHNSRTRTTTNDDAVYPVYKTVRQSLVYAGTVIKHQITLHRIYKTMLPHFCFKID